LQNEVTFCSLSEIGVQTQGDHVNQTVQTCPQEAQKAWKFYGLNRLSDEITDTVGVASLQL
jgi:hypothetical protein